MIPEQFAILTVILSLIGGRSYIIGTLKGETKPNRVTWGLISVFTAIVVGASLDAGVSWPLASAATALFNTTTIFVASFVNPKAYWKTTRQDYLFGAIALVGLLLWQVTDNPNLAIGFSIMADFFAAFPTFIKAYKSPKTEDGSAFAVWIASHVVTLLIINDWTFANHAFPAYLVLFNAIPAYFILVRPRGRVQ